MNKDELMDAGNPQVDDTYDPRMKVGIVGHGFVGGAVDYAFTHKDIEKFYVDPKHDTTIDDLVEIYSPLVNEFDSDIVTIQISSINQEETIRLLGKELLPKLRK